MKTSASRIERHFVTITLTLTAAWFAVSPVGPGTCTFLTCLIGKRKGRSDDQLIFSGRPYIFGNLLQSIFPCMVLANGKPIRGETLTHKYIVWLIAFFFGSQMMSGSSLADEGQKPELTWLRIDWQPAWIYDGPLKGLGYAQTVERLLQERMTGYEHTARSITNVRIYSVLQNRESCFAASSYKGSDLQEAKKKGVIWSAPAYVFFYQGIIARPDAVAKIREYETDGHIDFLALINDDELIGAFQPGRSYSQWLNPILDNEQLTSKMFRWSGNAQLTQSMFKLMEAERIDYFVDYVIMLKFHQASTGALNKYVYMPIQEHKKRLGFGAIACSDTPQGRKVIAEINDILADIRLTDAVRDTNRRWLMPEEQEEEYWRMWETELLPLKK